MVETVVLDVTTVPVDDGDNNNGEEPEVEDVGDVLVDEADAYVDGEEEGFRGMAQKQVRRWLTDLNSLRRTL